MDCVSLACGQTICLDAFSEHSQTIPSGRRRENTTRKRLEKFVFVKRLSQAASRVVVSAGSTSVNIQIRTDASPYAFGQMIIRYHGSAEAYWADSLSDDESSRFRSVKGDPAWQAEWEPQPFAFHAQ